MDYNLKIMGERIKTQRKELGLSQFELSGMLSCDRGVLGKYEKGERIPPLDLLFRMCEKFDCELGYLLGEYDEKTRTNTDICKETGLNETAISLLKKWLSFGLGRYIDVPIKEKTVTGQITCEYNKPTYIVNLLFNNPHIIGLIYLYLTLTDEEKSTVYQGDRSTTVLFELMHELRLLRDNFQPVYKKEFLKFYEADGVNNGEHTGKTE